MKFNELGRSMVEMLGVLAIIGVLSVGAISGYSTAMTKYKLNKQTEQLTTTFNNSIIYSETMIFDKTTHLTSYFRKMNLVPDEMIFDKNSPYYENYIKDVFGNRIAITYVIGGNISYNMLSIQNDSSIPEACVNLLQILKEYRDSIDIVQLGSTMFYGDGRCNDGNLCLRTASLNDFNNACVDCKSIIITYNYKNI